jgi:hypothetical protein
MKLPDRFGQPEGGVVPMEHYHNPPLNPIFFLGNTATPEEKGRHEHHPPPLSRLLQTFKELKRCFSDNQAFLHYSSKPSRPKPFN